MSRVQRALSIVIGATIFLIAVRVQAKGSASVYRDLELLGQSLTIVRDAYVDPVDVSVMVDNAMRSMVEALDQHSTYLDAEELDVVREEADGRFGGIGLVVARRNGYLTAVAPLEGSPAAGAGIRPADVILEIDGVTTLGMPLRRAVALMRGPVRTWVELLIGRQGVHGDFAVRIQRGEIIIPNIPYSFPLDGPAGARVAYVRLATFSRSASAQCRRAIEQLVTGGCTSVILDIRANPGGLLEEAVAVSDLFLRSGVPICYTIGHKGTQRVDYLSTATPVADPLPLVVLIDEGTASAAEILAGALQDNREGVLLGRSSFGKGTVQEIRELGDGTAIKLTTARWFTPGGFCIDRELGTVDTTRLASSTPVRTGLAPNLLISGPSADRLNVELTAALPGSLLDSLAKANLPTSADPRALRIDDRILDGIDAWLLNESPLVQADRDSALALAASMADSRGLTCAFLGTELARRWWGEVGSAQYSAAHDTVIQAALTVLSNPAAYDDALDRRAEVDADSPDDEFDE